MKHHLLSILATLCIASTATAQNTDTWVATDALGRKTPTSEEAPLKTDAKPRTVGIFYITWHTPGLHNGKPYRADVTRVLQQDPGARMNNDSPAWTAGSYHWGEPEYGYFLSQDRYVIRHDLMMLADAGVDVLILDVTNAVHYWDEWEALFQTMTEMKAEGNRVPQFCFWAFNGPTTWVVQQLYDRYYKTPRYEDLWFRWQGKPLLLYNAKPDVDANHTGGGMDKNDYSPEVKQFFTLRNMWWGYYKWAGERFVGTEDNWSFGYDMHDPDVGNMTPAERASRHNGHLEEMAVTPAQHPVSIVGKSWRLGTGQPKLNDHDMPEPTYVPWLGRTVDNPTAYGIYFQDRWDEALSVDPEFIYLNDWNEWTAGKYKSGIDPSGQLPGPTTFLGRKNPFYFVDQYNAEFNRTIAPMKGGWTDNYYMQMVENIRRYKGVAPIPVNHGLHSGPVNPDGAKWSDKDLVTYEDTRGDVVHRDHDGYGDLHYTDQSGRNDILLSRVAVDKKNLYFYAETDKPLTPSSDPHWMLLLINADQDATTGWEGYDYLINQRVLSTDRTTLMRYDALHGQWIQVAELPYAVSGAHLEVAVPRKLIGAGGKHIALDFKWADNPCDLRSIISLCTTGDTAPNRRFAYRFLWER